MNGLLRTCSVACVLGCWAPACFAQALVEHAAAAAVGTAGSAGGKVLSNALDRVFKKTDAALQGKEAKQPSATGEQRKKAEAAAAAASAIPTTPRPASRRLSRPTIAGTAISITQPAFEPPPFVGNLQPAAPPTPVVTADDFARVSPGSTRQDLLTQVGQPAYRVRISGDGHVQEFYRYSSGGVDLGSVRVTDGTVTAVRARKN